MRQANATERSVLADYLADVVSHFEEFCLADDLVKESSYEVRQAVINLLESIRVGCKWRQEQCMPKTPDPRPQISSPRGWHESSKMNPQSGVVGGWWLSA